MNYNEIFTKPERPFLLIYENESNNYIEWLETKEELMERIEKIKKREYIVTEAIEIGSCRELF